jgi:hypothetical protein
MKIPIRVQLRNGRHASLGFQPCPKVQWAKRTKANLLSCPAVAVRSCTVSFTGPTGIRHSVEVIGETLYEAAVRGLHLLRQDGWADRIAPGTELRVEVREPATAHTVTVAQLQRWCDGIAVSPDEILKKRKMKALLG